MSAKARVLLMGYGEAGRQGLRALSECGAVVVGVLGRTADLERKEDSGSIYSEARALGLKALEHHDPNGEAFLAEASRLSPDYIVSLQYDRILKPKILSVPKKGSVNLHYGPLPRLRGCFPTKWAIIDDEPGGATLHWISPGIDDGNIIDQERVPLDPNETDRTLYAKVTKAGERVFARHVQQIRDLRVPAGTPQDPARASYHPKAFPHGGTIDWSKGTAWVERFIRAFTFPPHPGAKTWCGDVEVQLRAPVETATGPMAAPGAFHFSPDGALWISAGGGWIVARTVLVGGRERPAASLKELVPSAAVFAAAPA